MSENITSRLGYSLQEVLNNPDFWRENIHPDDRTRIFEHYGVLYQEGHHIHEYRFRKKDGTYLWILDELRLIRDPEGNPVEIVGSWLDITKRKQAEEALFEANNIINRSPAVAFLWENKEGWPVRFVSKNVEKIFGYSVQDFLEGRVAYSEVIHNNDLERVVGEVISYSSKEGLQTFTHDPYRVVTKNGDIKWVEDRTYIRRGPLGTITHYEGIVYDITARKQAEDALRESELRFRMLSEYTYDWEYWINPEGKYIYLSPSCERIAGYSPEEFISNPKLLFDMIRFDYAEKFHQHYEDEAKEETPVFSLVVPIITKNGEERWLEHNCSPVFDGQGNYAGRLGNNRDITERKQAEEARARLNIQLEAKNKELEQIVSVTSHDLRSPLVSIEGFSDVLETSLEEILSALDSEGLSSEARGKLDQSVKNSRISIGYINKSASKMESLLDGLLQVSRLGQLETKKEELCMNMLMSDVLCGLKFQSEEKGAMIEIAELPSCQGDEGQINQLFTNLVSNALKYSDPDRPCIVKISGQKEGAQSVYYVEDNGIGIDPEFQEKIFILFHQLDPGVAGEGLGLSIVQKIVERHNGRMWVESEFGKGSRFYVLL